MKAIFLIFHGFNPSNGISKKIHYQVKALCANGFDTRLVHYDVLPDGRRVWKADDETIADLGSGILAKLRKRFDYSPLIAYIRKEKVDFIYMRSDHNANPFSIAMVNAIRRSGAKIVMEIPTYPYDQEYVTLRMKADLLVDRLFRRRMARHLDRIVTFSDAADIFGCATLRISNGIDFEAIPMRQHTRNTSRELHLIGVAEIHFWHGFDRVIAGLARYYQQEQDCKVLFRIVGPFFDVKDEELGKRMIADNRLEDYVTLVGPQSGEELDKSFEEADFAIGSLGRHRSGITRIKTLKNREYAARGFSFIYSETDEDFEDKPYILKAPADESPIDIRRIVDFCATHTFAPAEIRESVRPLSWTAQMGKVLDTIYPNR